MISGPIVLIEDDPDDIYIFDEVLKELGIANRLVKFTNPRDAYHFLDSVSEQPFLIISDVNLPQMSGLELKNKIDSNERLRKKSIPFIFFSTSAEKKYILESYLQLTVQGYFQKPAQFTEIKQQVRAILEYWKLCLHPNS